MLLLANHPKHKVATEDLHDVKIVVLVLGVGTEPVEQEMVVVLCSHTVIGNVVLGVVRVRKAHSCRCLHYRRTRRQAIGDS